MTQEVAAVLSPARPECLPVEIDYSLAIPFDFSDFARTEPTIAVICHIFFEDLTMELRRFIENIPFPFDTFISTDTAEKKTAIQRQFENWRRGSVDVRILPNRGRDIAAKLVGFKDVYPHYEYVLHIHSKKSLQETVHANWRRSLCENLVGSMQTVESVLFAFNRFPSLGIVASQHFESVRDKINWSQNFEIASRLASRFGLDLSMSQTLDFPSGSMFWARSAALQPLLDLDLSYDDFPTEIGQFDGTPAHAIERLFFYACEAAGYFWIKVASPLVFENTPCITQVNSPAALDQFVKEHVVTLLSPLHMPESECRPVLAGR